MVFLMTFMQAVLGCHIFRLAECTCYQGWFQERNKCYREYITPVSWKEATEMCEVCHSELVTLNDITEQTFVMQLRDPEVDSSWIGYNRNGSVWQWISPGNASFNQLDTFNATAGENCAALSKLGRWVPTNCFSRLPYVCESTFIGCEKSHGWFVHEAQCLFLTGESDTWMHAKEKCFEMGADLAVFKRIYKNGLILLQNGLTGVAWIGLVFNKEENQFVWSDGTTLTQAEVASLTGGSSLTNVCGTISVPRNSTHDIIYNGASCDSTYRALCEKCLVNDVIQTSTPEATTRSTHSVQEQVQRTVVNPFLHALMHLSKCFESIANSAHPSECLKEILTTAEDLCDVDVLAADIKSVQSAIAEIFNVNFFKNIVDSLDHFISPNFSFTLCEHSEFAAFLMLENILEIAFNINDFRDLRVLSSKVEVATWVRTDAAKDGEDLFDSNITGCIVKYVGGNWNENQAVFAVIYSDGPVEVFTETGLSEKYSRVYLVSSVLTVIYREDGTKASAAISFSTLYFNVNYLAGKTGLNISESKVICGFFVRTTRLWSSRGCFVDYSDEYSVSCLCNHTTSFGVLMKVRTFEMEREHELALSVITYIGCSVSMISVFLALTVFTCIRSLNSERVFVHRSLCLAILCSQVVYLAGGKAINNQLVCRITAVVLHYCFMAVFSWVLVEGLHLYTKVVQVFATERARSMYYTCFGWGLPLVLVAISAVADWDGYGTKKSCWLSIDRNTIWAFVGPAVAVLIVNLIILIMVLRIVVNSAKMERSSTPHELRAAAKATLFLLPLLGLTWIFGLLVVNRNLVVFEYLFAITNSLQGFFVFLFHCVLNSEVRQALQIIRARRSLQNQEFPTEAFTSTDSSHSQSTVAVEGTIRVRLKYTGTFKLHQQPKSETRTKVTTTKHSAESTKLKECEPLKSSSSTVPEEPCDLTLIYI